ncbi:MAG: alpha/beta fold hydrolase [Parvibaculum sp.]|uniref:alpha/beta hydrolase family protein n=1 Tax=Parvibaculum sp. TaxID=2024848 RepID=UPI00283C8C2D|nr:alpha/beta fold hydrolase [Parvibaculum sp.]MDR3498806.1 alpha/beta fold hydrolase [Parvibaculum sp.]
MFGTWRLFALGLVLILAGGFLASAIQTSGGIEIRDVRFAGAGGVEMSALLYVPANATKATPAPGILAVHGYINSRETQNGFAIEFARRGYVVLALDQTGHGFSGGAAFSNGFGGPDGLKYLRSLDMVDTANIGLEGHSMGGWTVLAAAAAMPDAYRAIVLEGSATGAPFAAEGSTTWPRNLALVFSRYDEFSKLMWGVDRGRDVATSAKLQAVFGTTAPVEIGRIYGSIAEGTARVLYTPWTTHPGDHLSTVAIGDSLDWFAKTLKGGTPRAASDQIWIWREVGTGAALLGFVALLLGTFDLLLALPAFAPLRHAPMPVVEARDGRWWAALLLMIFLPILTYFPFFILGGLVLPPSFVFKQGITNQVLVWALLNAALTLVIGFALRRPMPVFNADWRRAVPLAIATVAMGYAALALADLAFKIDFRFWVVALKLFTPKQFGIALIYLLPFTAFFLVTLRALHGLAVKSDGPFRQYASALAALALGFLILLAIDYGALLLNGKLLTDFDPLSTVIAMQFLPLMAAIAIIAVFAWRRTNSYLPGALICGLLVTWYIVAGTATQAV